MMKRNPILVMLAVLFVAFGAAGEEKETVKVKSGALLEVWQLPKNYRWGTRPQTPAVGSIVDNGNGWSVKALADSEELASMQSARNLMLKWSGLRAGQEVRRVEVFDRRTDQGRLFDSSSG